MREIKFRKWAMHTDGQMHVVDDIILGGATLNSLREGDGDILMQYTGLKDKNGKEIYEGDVVKMECYDGHTRQYEVVYSRASFVLRWIIADDDVRIPIQDDYQMEVIGNIYENPDLLKQ